MDINVSKKKQTNMTAHDTETVILRRGRIKTMVGRQSRPGEKYGGSMRW